MKRSKPFYTLGRMMSRSQKQDVGCTLKCRMYLNEGKENRNKVPESCARVNS